MVGLAVGFSVTFKSGVFLFLSLTKIMLGRRVLVILIKFRWIVFLEGPRPGYVSLRLSRIIDWPVNKSRDDAGSRISYLSQNFVTISFVSLSAGTSSNSGWIRVRIQL